MSLQEDVWANTDGPLLFTCFGDNWKCGVWWAIMPRFQGPVWDDIFTPTISSSRGENIVTIFSPPLRYFHPLTISNGKSFCSQISLNFIMCIYNKEPFYTFYDFLQIFVNHRLLIQSINISTKTLSSNSKEGIMLKYNHFNPPSFM